MPCPNRVAVSTSAIVVISGIRLALGSIGAAALLALQLRVFLPELAVLAFQLRDVCSVRRPELREVEVQRVDHLLLLFVVLLEREVFTLIPVARRRGVVEHLVRRRELGRYAVAVRGRVAELRLVVVAGLLH